MCDAPAVHALVADIVDLGTDGIAILRAAVFGRLAEQAGERDLGPLVELLVAHHNGAMAMEGGNDLGQQARRGRGEVDAGDLDAEAGFERFEFGIDEHRRVPP